MNLFEKLRNMKILLIDDDEWIRDSLSMLFETEGCQLSALETAEQGLEALMVQPYDIVIIDYRLPGMNGLEFLKQIPKSETNIIYILISAYGTKEVVSEAIELGVQEFISKPFTSKTIEAALTRLIQNQERNLENHVNHTE